MDDGADVTPPAAEAADALTVEEETEMVSDDDTATVPDVEPADDVKRLQASHQALKGDMHTLRQKHKELKTSAAQLRDEVTAKDARIAELEAGFLQRDTVDLLKRYDLFTDADDPRTDKEKLIWAQPTMELREALAKQFDTRPPIRNVFKNSVEPTPFGAGAASSYRATATPAERLASSSDIPVQQKQKRRLFGR